MHQPVPIPINNQPISFCTFTGTKPGNGYTEQPYTCISLHKFFNQETAYLPFGNIKQADTIINDVPSKMLVSTNKDILTSIIRCLLCSIVVKGENNIIHISAKLIGTITLIHIRNCQAAYNDTIAKATQKIEPLAETLGGCVTISNNKRDGLTLALTFINH